VKPKPGKKRVAEPWGPRSPRHSTGRADHLSFKWTAKARNDSILQETRQVRQVTGTGANESRKKRPISRNRTQGRSSKPSLKKKAHPQTPKKKKGNYTGYFSEGRSQHTANDLQRHHHYARKNRKPSFSLTCPTPPSNQLAKRRQLASSYWSSWIKKAERTQGLE